MNRSGLNSATNAGNIQDIGSGRHTNRALKGMEDDLLADLSNSHNLLIIAIQYYSKTHRCALCY